METIAPACPFDPHPSSCEAFRYCPPCRYESSRSSPNPCAAEAWVAALTGSCVSPSASSPRSRGACCHGRDVAVRQLAAAGRRRARSPEIHPVCEIASLLDHIFALTTVVFTRELGPDVDVLTAAPRIHSSRRGVTLSTSPVLQRLLHPEKIWQRGPYSPRCTPPTERGSRQKIGGRSQWRWQKKSQFPRRLKRSRRRTRTEDRARLQDRLERTRPLCRIFGRLIRGRDGGSSVLIRTGTGRDGRAALQQLYGCTYTCRDVAMYTHTHEHDCEHGIGCWLLYLPVYLHLTVQTVRLHCVAAVAWDTASALGG